MHMQIKLRGFEQFSLIDCIILLTLHFMCHHANRPRGLLRWRQRKLGVRISNVLGLDFHNFWIINNI